MCKRISDGLRHASRGWVALLALAIFLAFSVLVLPRQAAQAEQHSGDAGSPDTSFIYSPADLYRMAETYGEQGRQAYVRARFTFDLVWPLVYAFFLTTAISWVYGKAFAANSRWHLANLASPIGALFDYLENVSTSVVMLRYPAHTGLIDVLAPVFTLLKWLFLVSGFVLLFVGIAAAAWRWSKDRGIGAAPISH
jgi:hypothetical protein